MFTYFNTSPNFNNNPGSNPEESDLCYVEGGLEKKKMALDEREDSRTQPESSSLKRCDPIAKSDRSARRRAPVPRKVISRTRAPSWTEVSPLYHDDETQDKPGKNPSQRKREAFPMLNPKLIASP
ncbi:unnamed protein product [Pleuronectes platessa]|uniref:Uncharacterized protein n=1 Tax=Pleuronectes platessa TaxID=8262 RepID=A0A9N7U5A9_PLEPL|nr:unnamed protein product [Pleuronectes platessa]